MSARQQDAPAPVQTRIRKPSVEKRSWRVTGDPEEARKAQILIRAAMRKA